MKKALPEQKKELGAVNSLAEQQLEIEAVKMDLAEQQQEREACPAKCVA